MTSSSSEASIEERDRRSVLHPASPLGRDDLLAGLVIESGHGCRVRDVHGRELLDGGAGLWCVNVGYGRSELGRAAADEMSRLGYYHTFAGVSNPPQIELAERLLGLVRGHTPFKNAGRVFFGLSGSDANDTQMKIVRAYNNIRGRPEKKKIVSRVGAYHGVSIASASLTGIPAFHQAFDLPIDGVLHTARPHFYRDGREGESEAQFSERLAGELDALIEREGADTVAAFIAEPVMGAGGVYLPPAGYFARIQEVLRRHDVLLIVDEVICGFGRLGQWFGSGVYDIRPDLMSCAKGLTSGYFPLSAAIVSDEIHETLRKGPADGAFSHGYTYSGHPVGAAVAIANLDLFEREDLVANAARMGERLQARLRESLAGHRHVGEVRGIGLIAAIELVADRATRAPFDAALAAHKQVSAEAAQQGLLIRALPGCDAVAFSPPLCVSEGEIDEMVEIVTKSLDAVCDRLDAG